MKRLAALILLLLVGTTQAGGVYTNTASGIVVKDEGASQGGISSLDCTGAGVSCSVVGGTATVSVPGATLKDEGASQGAISTLDCVGDGVACAVAGSAGTITVTAGSSFSGLSITSSTNVNIPGSTTSPLPLQGTEDWDTDSYHSGTDAFITIPTTGRYEVNLIFYNSGLHPYSWTLWLVKNDAGNDCADFTPLTGVRGAQPPLSYSSTQDTPIYFGIFSLAAGDTLELCASHNGTANLSHAATLFQVTRR